MPHPSLPLLQRRRRAALALLVLLLAVLAVLGLGAWALRQPPVPAPVAPPVPGAERQALVDALKPHPQRARTARPLIAVVGLNDATETTDYLMPTGILRRADVADVQLLATAPGAVKLYPALQVLPDATLAAFDAAHPAGADYVIVPAMRRDDDPVVLAWLQRQAAQGARIIGVCAGAKVVAAAGLLDGKRATTHWYYRRELLSRHPSIQPVADRRLVADGSVTTTTGISASMPLTLALVEAIAGPARAEAVARAIGHAPWDMRHASEAFRMTPRFASSVLVNRLAFWRHEVLDVALEPGVDEVALALIADAWSRTYRSQVHTFAPTAAPVRSRHGVQFVPELTGSPSPPTPPLAPWADQPPAQALERTLAAIAERYGQRTRELVAMQLEYPPRPAPAAPAPHPQP